MVMSVLPGSPSPPSGEETTAKTEDDHLQDRSTTTMDQEEVPSQSSPPLSSSSDDEEEDETYEELHPSSSNIIHDGKQFKRALWQSSELIAYAWVVCTVAAVITATVSPHQHLKRLLVYAGLSAHMAALMVVVELNRQDFVALPISPKMFQIWNPHLGKCCNIWTYANVLITALTITTVMKLEMFILVLVVLNLLRLCYVFGNHLRNPIAISDDPNNADTIVEPTAEDSMREPLLSSDDASGENV